MNIYAWFGVLILSGITLIILIPEFIHELKWRRKEKHRG